MKRDGARAGISNERVAVVDLAKGALVGCRPKLLKMAGGVPEPANRPALSCWRPDGPQDNVVPIWP